MKTSRNLCSCLVLLAVVVLASCSTAEDKKDLVFYINNQSDFDQYKDAEFPAGSTILFAAGKIFNGQFAPTGSGTPDNPIVLTAYDPKSNKILLDNIDNKPIINGHGKVNSAFFLYNGQFWEINNLEVTNTDGTADDQGDLRGIHVVAENIGLAEHIIIRNCYVHDVNGDVGGKLRGGIHIHVWGGRQGELEGHMAQDPKAVKTRFHNVLIENNVVSRVGGVGIGNQSSWSNIDTEDYYPWTGLVIRGNRVEHTGRNGIIVRYSIDPLVEYNVLAYNSRFSTGHSVFNFNTVGCVMQYNEAYGNTGELDDIDRGGFDADWNSRGTIIQYNYSHDNHWFCGIMRQYNRDIKIRYNISQNERLAAYMYGFPWVDNARSIWVYNNTHYFRAGLNASIFASPGRVRTPSHTAFYNNIFYFEDSGSWGLEPDETCEFSHNLFFNVEPRGRLFLTEDPLFVNPGTGGTDIDMKDPERLSGYQLKKTSPCLGAGMFINDHGGKDFWGHPLDQRHPDIGAFQSSGNKSAH